MNQQETESRQSSQRQRRAGGVTVRVLAALVAALAIAWWQLAPASTQSDSAGTPAAPSALTATPALDSIALSWSAPDDDGGAAITSYRLAWREHGHGRQVPWQRAEVGAEARAFDITGLTSDVTYLVRVRATNLNGAGEWATADPSRVGPRRTPEKLKVSGSSELSISLQWQAPRVPIGEVTHYEYRFRPRHDESAKWSRGTINAALADRDDGWLGVEVDQIDTRAAYRFGVRAHDAHGAGSWSQMAYSKAQLGPAAISGLSADEREKELRLTWDTAFGAAWYNVSYAPVDGSRAATVVRTKVTRFKLTRELATGVRYSFQVRASNNIGASDWSTAIEAQVRHPGDPPTLTEVAGFNGTIKAKWNNPADRGYPNQAYYRFQYRPVGSGAEWKHFAGFPDAQWAAVSATNGVTYQLRARAGGPGGLSEWTQIVQVTPKAQAELEVPQTPTAFRSSAEIGKVHLFWEEQDGASTYEVSFAPVDDPADETMIALAANRLTLTQLEQGVAYLFKVRATNLKGASAWSSTIRKQVHQIADPPTITSTSGLDGKITITWDDPEERGFPPLLTYHIFYEEVTPLDDARREFAYGYPDKGGTWSVSVKPGATYRVLIESFNLAGTSERITLPLIDVVVPGPPNPVRFDAVYPQPQQISATWFLPEWHEQNEPHTYEVELENRKTWATQTKWLTHPSSYVLFTNLENYVKYGIRVRAHNKHGASEWTYFPRSTPRPWND